MTCCSASVYGPSPWPPSSAQTNGCVERVQQTILDECWKPAFARYRIPKQTGLRLDLERYLRYYNTERAHTGRWTKGRTPEAVLGKAKLWHHNR
jgi:Integrase core domain